MISNIDKSEAIPMLFIPSVEQTAMKTLKKEYALYIHIPYCEKKCHFCSIPVTRFTDEMVLDRYVDALLYELKYKVNNPVPVSLLSGDRKPQIRFLGNHHSGSGNLYHKSFRM